MFCHAVRLTLVLSCFLSLRATAEAEPGPDRSEQDRIVQIDTERNLTCARSEAGRVWCWGGLAENPAEASPGAMGIPVATAVEGLDGANSLSVGSERACASLRSGKLMCWSLSHTRAGRVALGRAKAIPGFNRIRALDLAGERICAADEDGWILCVRGRQRPTKVGRLIGTVQLAVGPDHACALTGGGEVVCWGKPGPQLGGRAQAGDPFVRVSGVDARDLVVRDRASCASSKDGRLVCWGMQKNLAVRGRSPLARPGFSKTVQVSLGEGHLCAVDKGGKVLCQGQSQFGQLGDGKVKSVDRHRSWGQERKIGLATPVVALCPRPTTQVTAGAQHTCGLGGKGGVWCWGANQMGQLGDGSQADRPRPVRVAGLPGDGPSGKGRKYDDRALTLAVTAGASPSWFDSGRLPAQKKKPSRYGSRWGRPSSAYKRHTPFREGLEHKVTGVQAAVFEAGHGRFLGVHRSLGVLDGLQLPVDDYRWMALDGEDALWLAGQDGSLYRAKDLDAAQRKSGFSKVASYPDAKLFDASRGLVVVAWEDQLRLSTDGGKIFRAAVPEQGLQIERVFARYDGVILVQGQMEGEGQLTMISADHGESFFPSAFEPETLARQGSWIYSDRCPPAVLSQDPERWSKRGEYDDPPSFGEWSRPLDGSQWVRAFDLGKNPSSQINPPPPPAPADGAEVTGADGECPRVGGGGVGMLGRGGGGRGETAPGCGVNCLRGTSGAQRPAPKTRFYFLQDADCDAERGTCQVDGALRRKPHVAVVAKRDTRLMEAACDRPVRMLSAAGLGLMLCTLDGQTIIHSLTGSARSFVSEGVSDLEAVHIQSVLAGRDGTLVLVPRCGKGGDCPKALVRLPASPGGSKSPWRKTQLAGVIAYRALARGQVLVVTRSQAGPGHLSLWIDRPGQAPAAVAEDVQVDGDPVQLEIDDKGRLIFTVIMTTRGRQDLVLTRSGHFKPLPVRPNNP